MVGNLNLVQKIKIKSPTDLMPVTIFFGKTNVGHFFLFDKSSGTKLLYAKRLLEVVGIQKCSPTKLPKKGKICFDRTNRNNVSVNFCFAQFFLLLKKKKVAIHYLFSIYKKNTFCCQYLVP